MIVNLYDSKLSVLLFFRLGKILHQVHDVQCHHRHRLNFLNQPSSLLAVLVYVVLLAVSVAYNVRESVQTDALRDVVVHDDDYLHRLDAVLKVYETGRCLQDCLLPNLPNRPASCNYHHDIFHKDPCHDN